MTGRLEGRVALVTGAGRGIGRATAMKLAAEGARVVLNDLDAEPAAEVVEAVRAAGGEALACPGDVRDDDFPPRFVAAAVDGFGGLDIVVNNAGYTWDNVIQKMTDEAWRAVLDVHLTAPFRILRAAQPVIRDLAAAERAAGRLRTRKVVNVSSVAGLYGNAGQANYASAKAGIIGLTMTLAREWGRLNTTVNCVAFGIIATRLAGDVADGTVARIDGRDIRLGINSEVRARMEASIPLGRLGTPEEAAGAVCLFTLPEADYVSGQTLLCSGGLVGV